MSEINAQNAGYFSQLAYAPVGTVDLVRSLAVGRQRAVAECRLDCFLGKHLDTLQRCFVRPVRSILSMGDKVRRHDMVSWSGDRVNWVTTDGQSSRSTS
jgi:hypothetical protein